MSIVRTLKVTGFIVPFGSSEDAGDIVETICADMEAFAKLLFNLAEYYSKEYDDQSVHTICDHVKTIQAKAETVRDLLYDHTENLNGVLATE